MKEAILMVVVQIILAGLNVLFKLAINDGMSLSILVAYRYLFASLFITPVALSLEKGKRPPMTRWVLFYAFITGLFGGSLCQNLYLEGMAMTSATFAAAMINLAPAITFLLAVCLRMEKLNITSVGGVAKVVGTIVGIGGAMLLIFYKGFEINIWSTHFDLLNNGQPHKVKPFHKNQLLGSLFSVGSCISFSLWLISQTKMTKIYPCYYSSTALMCIAASIQSIVFSLCMERDWNQWKLGWDVRLLTVAYGGIMASCVVISLISWCVSKKGPLYVSVFNPLLLVIVAIVGSFCLNEQLHLGSVVGGILIVCGLYIVLWGKKKEIEKVVEFLPNTTTTTTTPGSNIEVIVTTPTHHTASELNPQE